MLPHTMDIPSRAPLLNLRQLETFCIIGYDDYLELLGDLSLEVPARLEQIRAAIEHGDAVELKTIAHSLRGILAYFGCAALNERFAALEAPDAVAPPEQAAAIDGQLQTLWQDSLAAIKAWEKSVPGFAQGV